MCSQKLHGGLLPPHSKNQEYKFYKITCYKRKQDSYSKVEIKIIRVVGYDKVYPALLPSVCAPTHCLSRVCY